MAQLADACRASAYRCAEIAATTSTAEDSCEFKTFAATWQRLAREIECSERLINLIDELGSHSSAGSKSAREAVQLPEQKANANSLRRLAIAILSVSHHYMTTMAGHKEEPGAA
jgi:hypothetical protein